MQGWVEYTWLRLRWMDWWNPNHIYGNVPARTFRGKSPGAQVCGLVKKHDDAVGTNNFSVRYFHRDQMRRDTAYYPDTPLSLNHSIMKPPHSQGLRPSLEPPAKLPNPPSFGFKKFGYGAHSGIKSKSQEAYGGPSNPDKGIPL